MKTAPLFCLMVLLSLLLASCGDYRIDQSVHDFRNQYESLPENESSEKILKFNPYKISLTANAVPLVDLLRQISDQASVSVIAAQNLDKETVSLEVKGATVDAVLGAVARRLGVRLTKIGSIFYLGQISPEDRAFLVRRLHRLSQVEMEKILALFVSEYGHYVAFADGLLVFTDRVEILERVAAALDQVEDAESPSWVVQVYIIDVSKNLQHKLGIDLSQSVTFSYKINQSAGATSASGSLNALLVSTHDDTDSSIVAEPMFLIKDGFSANLTDGINQPVPKFTVSPQGTMEVTGFDVVQTGLIVTAQIREESLKRAKLSLSVELSKITGSVQNYPIIAKQKLVTDASIDSAGTYLIGELSQASKLQGLSGNVAPSVYDYERTSGDLQVWVRAYKIKGEVVQPGD